MNAMTEMLDVAMGADAADETEETPAHRGIRIQGLRKHFTRRGSRDRVIAIDGIDITVAPGELVVLLGASGCGKTTILRCLAGLETPDGGEIIVDGRTMYSEEGKITVPVNKRRISVIFQGYALWPHMTVFENVAYPLRCQGVRTGSALTESVERTLALVGLAGLGKEYPGTLSGGQQQRVALARALVSDPPVVLFDEPLSNVDAQIRHQLRQEIWAMHSRVGFSAMYVTHDQEEALSLGDKIVLLNNGVVVQQGTPQEVYSNPATKYAAEFIGRANTIAVTMGGADESGLVVLDSVIGPLTVAASAITAGAREGQAWAVIRPEEIVVLESESGFEGSVVRGRVVSRDFLGSSAEVRVATDSGETIRFEASARQKLPAEGKPIILGLPTSALRVVGE